MYIKRELVTLPQYLILSSSTTISPPTTTSFVKMSGYVPPIVKQAIGEKTVNEAMDNLVYSNGETYKINWPVAIAIGSFLLILILLFIFGCVKSHNKCEKLSNDPFLNTMEYKMRENGNTFKFMLYCTTY
jgi:hypothetical protein